VSNENDGFDSWCILELLGHVRMAGRVTEEEWFGSKMGRIDVPDGPGFVTVYFTANSVYRLTPTTEAVARAVAKGSRPQPVYRWELPAESVIDVEDDEPAGEGFDFTNELYGTGDDRDDDDSRDMEL
jgi:hypothetical protein